MRAPTPTLVQTPNVVRIRALMDQALNQPEGLEVRFTVAQYSTIESCKERAGSLQSQVASIRARARTSRQLAAGKRKNVEFSGEQISGPYDTLACAKRMLPNYEGYVVLLGPVTAHEEDFQIFNPVTGERILFEDPKTKRRDWFVKVIGEHVYLPGWRGDSGLTPEQEQDFYNLDPEVFTGTYEFCRIPLPAFVKSQQLPSADVEFDLVDTAIEDFGVDTGAGEL